MTTTSTLTDEQKNEIADINALVPDLKMKLEDVEAWEQEELRKQKESLTKGKESDENKAETETEKEKETKTNSIDNSVNDTESSNKRKLDDVSTEVVSGGMYCIVLYCIVLFCIVSYCIVLYCIILYYIVLYCIVLYCIIIVEGK